MKFTRLSLVAMLLVGSAAFAIENVKVSGDAKLFYSTQDDDNANATASLFDHTSSTGQAALGLGVSADLTKGVSSGAHLTALTTLGLQGQLVDNVWEGTNGTSDYFLFDEAWLAGTYGKTTAKAGRMTLDTPMVFTESWSIAKNTFEAAVVINQDIPDTTLVGAYVGGTNSNNIVNGVTGGSNETNSSVTGFGNAAGTMQSVNAKGTTNFSQFYKGAFAAGIINNSWKPLTAQAWYYDAPSYLNNYWVQADLNLDGILAGVQYTATNYTKSTMLPITKDSSNNAYAVMLGYEKKDVVTAKVSYSQTGEEKDSGLSLGAGYNLAGSQSKLYTEAWWYYGKISKADTSAFNITVTAPVAGYDLGIYYTQATIGKNGDNTATEKDFAEVTFEVARSFGPLDAGLYYIYTKSDADNIKTGNTKGDAYNTVQLYLTYNF
ncbi:porin [Sulfurimonas sp.]|uniref:porin n=1 Tax=Sulfurimonas sp. TaxID=2022749 RepID=UPI003563441C